MNPLPDLISPAHNAAILASTLVSLLITAGVLLLWIQQRRFQQAMFQRVWGSSTRRPAPPPASYRRKLEPLASPAVWFPPIGLVDPLTYRDDTGKSDAA